RKNEFLAILGHELRNPLAPIRTSLDMIARHPDRPVTPKLLEIMNRQLSYVTRLVDDLLDLSRITAGKIELRKEVLGFGELIEGAVAMARPQIEARRHALTVGGSDDLVLVDGDRTRLVQVVGNLLVNAARYTPPGGRVDVQWGRRGDNAYV